MSIATKTAGRDDVRAGILNASLALMNEGGLGALSMREVARRAGVSQQAPYHYRRPRGDPGRTGRRRVRQALRLHGECAGPRPRQAQPRPGDRRGLYPLRAEPSGSLQADVPLRDVRLVALSGCEGQGGSLLQRRGDCARRARRPGDKANPDLVPVIAAWSTAHGLATLLLEGKLGMTFGDTLDQREAAAKRVIAFFAERFAK